MFNVKVEATKNEILIPKSETFPAQFITMYWKNTRCCLAFRALVSRVLRDP